jgi:phage I-like protein
MRLLTALLASTLALNAQADGGWIQLLPAGEFAARDGRPGPGKKWKLTDEEGARIAAEFSALAAQTPIVVDYDHQTLYVAQHGGKAPAAGWMSGAEWRPGQGLFAKREWTAAATEFIDKKEYRYISPVLLYDPVTLKVHGVAMAALVNFPGLLGMHPAHTALATQFTQEKDHMNPILAALLSGLGLAETATLEQAQTALAALKARPAQAAIPAALATALKLQPGADEAAALAAVTALAKPDPNTLTAMAALQGEVAQLRAQINGDKATTTVDDAIKAGKLVPAMRDWALNLAKTDMAALNGYLATAPVIPMGGQSDGKDRGGAGGTHADAALAGEVMRGFGLTPEQFAKGAPAKA